MQAQLEEIKLQEEQAQKQLESMKESSRKSHQKCHQLERENRQLSEQMKKLSGFEAGSTTLINNLKAEVRELGKEKETLQNEVQVVKIEVCMHVCFYVTLCFLFQVQLYDLRIHAFSPSHVVNSSVHAPYRAQPR